MLTDKDILEIPPVAYYYVSPGRYLVLGKDGLTRMVCTTRYDRSLLHALHAARVPSVTRERLDELEAELDQTGMVRSEGGQD